MFLTQKPGRTIFHHCSDDVPKLTGQLQKSCDERRHVLYNTAQSALHAKDNDIS